MVERAEQKGMRRTVTRSISVGIKTGLANWQEMDWSAVRADFAEIHFQVALADKYSGLIQFLKRRAIQPALHFWAVLPGEILPTFAVADVAVCELTIELISRCIRFAADNGCAYVVYHPGPRRICHLSLSTGQFVVTDRETPADLSREIFIQNAGRLQRFAADCGVTVFIETETKRKPTWCFDETRIGTPLDAGDQTPETLKYLSSMHGVPLCIDTAHLATWYADEHSGNRKAMLRSMTSYARTAATAVGLVHLATVRPPYTVDTTSGFTDDEIDAGVFPGRAEVLQWLAVLSRSDGLLRLVPEPRMRDHVWHNRLMWQFVRQLEGLDLESDHKHGACAESSELGD